MTNLLGKQEPGSMAFVVLQNLIKFAVGHAITCANCETVMDYQKAVQADWMIGVDAGGTKRRKVSIAVCVKCWDQKVRDSLEKLEKHVGEDVLEAEFIDGRDFK